MLIRSLVLLLVAVAAPIASINAQTASDPVTIVITGSRTAQSVDETLIPVTVISRDDIEQSNANSVEALLQGQAGLSLANTGGLGKKGSLFLRGAEADHIVVLIDGIKINSATSGTAAIENLPLDQIERIEVVRGPRASLYGADAIGGVIQFFTRQPQTGFTPGLALSVGSHNTRKFAAGLARRGNKSWYRISVSQLDSAGFDACRGAPNVGGCFTQEPDDDGYENQSLSLTGGVQLSEGAQLSLNAMTSDADVEYDGDFVNRTESRNTTLGARLKIAVSENWDASLLLGQTRDEADNYMDATFGSAFNSRRESLTLQNDLYLNAFNTLTLGLDQHRESVGGTTAYTTTGRDNTGIFVQHQAAFGVNDLIASLRRDRFSDFGSETTGNVSFGRELANGLRVTAAYGTAFKAPTFNELYFPEFGNPDLIAETARSMDIGLRGNADKFGWTINLFDTRTDNLIAYDATAGLPVNIGRTQARGAEITLDTVLASWALKASHTWLDTENQSEDFFAKQLPRRAAHSARLDLSRALGAWQLGASLRAQGKSYDDLANTRRLDGFSVVDIRGAYAFSDDWEVNVAINNLFDADYETAEYYNEDGVNAMLTLRYQP